MATESPSAAAHVDVRGGVQPGETALRLGRSRDTLFIVPTAADHPERWRAIRRGPPGDLELVEVDDEIVADLARRDDAERVDVIDTPAWPVVFQ